MDNQHVASKTSSASSTSTTRNKSSTRSSNRRSHNRTKGISCKQQASQHKLKLEASCSDEIQMASLTSRRTSVQSPRVSMQSDRISFMDDRASNHDESRSRHRLDAWNSNQESFSRNELTVSRNFSSPTGAYTPNQSRYFDSRRNTFDRTSAIYTKGKFGLFSAWLLFPLFWHFTLVQLSWRFLTHMHTMGFSKKIFLVPRIVNSLDNPSFKRLFNFIKYLGDLFWPRKEKSKVKLTIKEKVKLALFYKSISYTWRSVCNYRY